VERLRFEEIAQEEFDSLPERLRDPIENVRIVVEDEPPHSRRGKTTILLGEYHGVPLKYRGAEYGVFPVVPDTITLYRLNILSLGEGDVLIRRNIRETLIHEIAHYYGLSESEIRRAGY
jgi:predicted Zn-dependent protease with MMP-like domain